MTQPALSVSTPNGRYYVHPGSKRQVPSITNIIGVKDKPALKFWAAKKCAEFASKDANLATLHALSEAERFDLIKGAPYRTTGAASNVGNIVHDWIDTYAKRQVANVPYERSEAPAGFDDAPITAKRMWIQFLGIVAHYDIRFVRSEFTVWSESVGYAGTGDFSATLRGGTVHLLGDTKTGNNAYPEVGMQLSAIAHADYFLSDNGAQAEIPRYDSYAVLHVRPQGAKLLPVRNIEECWTAFRCLRAVHRWMVDFQGHILLDAPKIATPLPSFAKGADPLGSDATGLR